MKRIILLICMLFSVPVFAQVPNNDFFVNAQDFFSKYIYKGRVKYDAVNKDSLLLNKLVQQIGSFNLRTAGKNSREAFYLNAYNILVIKAVADNYPLKSALDVPGFFDEQTHAFAGENLTLDEIEKITIGNEYDDPRIHFWLNPAAMGGPALNDNALTLYNVKDLIEEQTKATLNDNDFISVDADHKEALVPMLFKINESDFTRDGKTVLDFINSHRKKKISSDYKISYYYCNRDLNDWRVKANTKPAATEKKPAPEIAKNVPEKKDSIIEKPIEKPVVETIKDTAEKPLKKPFTKTKEKTIQKQKADTANTSDKIAAYQDILSPGSYMLKSNVQLVVSGSLNTQHSVYNTDLNRVDNTYRISYFNLATQYWNRISERINYGVQFSFRSLFVSDYNSSPYDALSFSNTKNSKFYFKDVTNSVKYLFCDRKYKITGMSSLILPGSKVNTVKYGKDSLSDNGLTLWDTQLFLVRKVSKYFTLSTGLDGTYRFGVTNTLLKFNVRGSMLPEFNYWVCRSLRFYAFCELNTQMNHGFFSNFYFREGTGLTFVTGKISQLDVQYNYYALGKKTSVTSYFLLGGRFNF